MLQLEIWKLSKMGWVNMSNHFPFLPFKSQNSTILVPPYHGPFGFKTPWTFYKIKNLKKKKKKKTTMNRFEKRVIYHQKTKILSVLQVHCGLLMKRDTQFLQAIWFLQGYTCIGKGGDTDLSWGRYCFLAPEQLWSVNIEHPKDPTWGGHWAF